MSAEELKAAHAELQQVYETMLTMRPGRLDGAGIDTLLAIGYAVGCISKAKALLGRDIDQIGVNPAN